MDYTPKEMVLYTGDEAGYLQKWYLRPLLEKLQLNEERNAQRQEMERKAGYAAELKARLAQNNASASTSMSGAQAQIEDGTFLTGMESLDEIPFENSDVSHGPAWKAHMDSINCVTYIKELDLVATCSFDKSVYIWKCDKDEALK